MYQLGVVVPLLSKLAAAHHIAWWLRPLCQHLLGLEEEDSAVAEVEVDEMFSF